jgi:hypothetical protein
MYMDCEGRIRLITQRGWPIWPDRMNPISQRATCKAAWNRRTLRDMGKLCVGLLFLSGVANAGPVPSDPSAQAIVPVDAPSPRRDGAQAARDGTFLPTVLSARIGDQRVAGLSLGGYESTPGRGALMSTMVEGALFHRVALRVGMEYVSEVGGVRPTVGVRVGILRQERHHVDVGVALVYKNLGFSEAKGGEFEIVAAISRRWGRVAAFGNLVYGQGIDPAERDGEARVAVLVGLGDRVNLGLDARARIDLGEETSARKSSKLESDFDFVAGPVLSVALGPVAFLAQVGGTAVVQQETPHGGVMAQGGLGGVF